MEYANRAEIRLRRRIASVGDDTVAMAQSTRAAGSATRLLLTGIPAPRIRT